MRFLAPEHLFWALLLVPVALLFLLRRTPQRVRVSSLSLFEDAASGQRIRPHRLRDVSALLLAVLTVLCAVAALARPTDSGAQAQVPRTAPRVVWHRAADGGDPYVGAALAAAADALDLRVSTRDTEPGDRSERIEIPGSGAVVLGVRGSAGEARESHVDALVTVADEHPILAGVAGDRLALLQTGDVTPTGLADVLWEGPHGALLTAAEDATRRAVVMAFSPEHSERLGLTASWPVLMTNALRWILAREPEAAPPSPGAALPAAALLAALLTLLALEALLFRTARGTMGRVRRRAFWIARALCAALVAGALAGPSCRYTGEEEAVVLALDRSASVDGDAVDAAARRLAAEAPRVETEDRAHTDLAAALTQAHALLEGRSRRGRIVLVTDGFETRGDAIGAARRLAAAGVRVDCALVAGAERPDVRVVRIRSSAGRVFEGSRIALTAELRSTHPVDVRVVLSRDGSEIESRTVALPPGRSTPVRFQVEAGTASMHTYTVRVAAENDALAENDAASLRVVVQGRVQVLVVEGGPGEGTALAAALTAGAMDVRTIAPAGLADVAAHHALILANVAAFDLPEGAFKTLEAHLQRGGALVVTGGPRAFGAGGYHGTPIAELLPVDVRPRERDATALVLVLDRSGSMRGSKMDLCRSAALAAAGTLRPEDRIGVIAFDVEPTWIAPLMAAGESKALRQRVAALGAGGGTNVLPAMRTALAALRDAEVRVKHMIVLSDGRTQSGDYEALARSAADARITISTVGIGARTDRALLASIARTAKGRHYATEDARDLPRIFTADTAEHAGRLVREASFEARMRDRHPMLHGWDPSEAGTLGGYVRTGARPAAAVSLLAPDDDPLLAHWRRGRGVVVAFTSDAAPRWAAGWLDEPARFARFWSQVVRDAVMAGTDAAPRAAPRPPQETTAGGGNRARLAAVAQAGGGVMLEPTAALPPHEVTRVVDLVPWLLQLFLLAFLVDLGIRRWEHLEGPYAAARAAVARRRAA